MSPKLAGLALLGVLLSGCLLPSAFPGGGRGLACAPAVVVSFDAAELDAALAKAGADERIPEPGLPFRAPDLDAVWRAYALRSMHWDAGLNEEGLRERDSPSAGLRQIEPGSDRVAISVGMGANNDETQVRALFDAFMRNVTDADDATLDEIFEELYRTRTDGVIMGDTVVAYNYGADADVPLTLTGFDEELRATQEPRNEPAGFGHATRAYFRYAFQFDVATRTLEVEEDGLTVLFESDGAAWSSATAGPTTDLSAGIDAIRKAIAARGMALQVDPARATARPGVHCD